jgi:hypothetical protein
MSFSCSVQAPPAQQAAAPSAARPAAGQQPDAPSPSKRRRRDEGGVQFAPQVYADIAAAMRPTIRAFVDEVQAAAERLQGNLERAAAAAFAEAGTGGA